MQGKSVTGFIGNPKQQEWKNKGLILAVFRLYGQAGMALQTSLEQQSMRGGNGLPPLIPDIGSTRHYRNRAFIVPQVELVRPLEVALAELGLNASSSPTSDGRVQSPTQSGYLIIASSELPSVP